MLISQNTDSFASALGRWMEDEGLSPYEAAPALGVSHQTIRNWLAGHLPPSPRLASLAANLGVNEGKLRRLITADRRIKKASEDGGGNAIRALDNRKQVRNPNGNHKSVHGGKVLPGSRP